MGDVFYTWGYLNDGVMLVSQRGIGDGWQLGGLRVGVELGSASHAEARRWSRRVRDMVVETFVTPADALAALLDARSVDAVLLDAIGVREYLRENPAADLHAEYLTLEFYAGAVRNDRRDVLYYLNGAMLTLLNDGTIDALLDRHLGPQPRPVSH
jgi:ABC-type amino acid transport substrate-binding protein